jgi:hypothetical protein
MIDLATARPVDFDISEACQCVKIFKVSPRLIELTYRFLDGGLLSVDIPEDMLEDCSNQEVVAFASGRLQSWGWGDKMEGKGLMFPTEKQHNIPDDCLYTIYVAGAYSGYIMDVAANIRRGRRVCIDLVLSGYNPYCPWNDWEWAVVRDIPVEDFQRVGIAHLLKSDAVLLVQGWEDSKGTKREIEIAQEMGIPIFKTLNELHTWREAKRLEKRKIL